jgi:hypothetical protein
MQSESCPVLVAAFVACSESAMHISFIRIRFRVEQGAENRKAKPDRWKSFSSRTYPQVHARSVMGAGMAYEQSRQGCFFFH